MDILETKKLARVLKALSNPNRLELFLEIMRKCEARFKTECSECLVAEIIHSFNIGAPTISHHLKELADADLITTERKGKYLVARINEITIGGLNKLFALKLKE